MDNSLRSLALNGGSVAISPKAFIGSIDSAMLSRNGAKFTGWAIQLSSADAAPARQFLVSTKGKVIGAFEPNADRPDIERKFGPTSLRCGLRIDLPLELIPQPLLPQFEFYAFDGKDIATQLDFYPPNDFLTPLRINSGADYIRLVQSPSTRLKDPGTLLFAALHALERFRDEFSICASAVCVIGYRLLESKEADPELSNVFEVACKRLLALKPPISSGLFLRWHTSMRLIAGYHYYRKGEREEAYAHFDAIIGFFVGLASWPQALTNILLGIYCAGYLSLELKNIDLAISIWERAEDVLRFGATAAQFNNYYAYGELGNAVQVARECRLAAMVVRNGGPLTDVSMAPEGIGLDPRSVPGPIGHLAAQARAVAGEDDRIEVYRGKRIPR